MVDLDQNLTSKQCASAAIHMILRKQLSDQFGAVGRKREGEEQSRETGAFSARERRRGVIASLLQPEVSPTEMILISWWTSAK